MLSEEEFHSFIAGMYGASVIAVDTETNGEDIRDGRGFLQGLSIAYNDRAEYFPFRHKYGENCPKEWLADIQRAFDNATAVTFHNAKFDLPSLETIGLTIKGKFYCTMLMAHMINENLPSKSLDMLSARFLNARKNKSDGKFTALVKAIGWANISAEVMYDYAKQDAVLALRLWQKFYPEFKKQGFDGELWEVEQKFIRLLASMERNGVRLDTDLCASQAIAGRDRMASITEILGFDCGKPSQLGNFLLNELKFPVVKWTQLDEEGNKTEKSKPSFDKFAMAEYDEMLEELGNDAARQIIAYRGWQRSCSVAYEGYPKLLSADGRIRPNFKLHGTVTSRLSCSDPNLQQIPKRSDKEWDGSLKAVFIPNDGYELWESDYSQLELRLGAAYAGEKGLIEEFSKPESDVFTRMAGELGFSRGDTKTLTYTLQYGGGVRRVKNVFKVDESRAKEIRDNYFNTYPGFRDITRFAAERAKARGYVKYWSGRRRHFADPTKESFKAFNSITQGGAAEIVKRSMLRLSEAGLSKYMLLQVHDSVVFELPAGSIEDFRPTIVEAMEAVDADKDFGVRFAVELKKWGE